MQAVTHMVRSLDALSTSISEDTTKSASDDHLIRGQSAEAGIESTNYLIFKNNKISLMLIFISLICLHTSLGRI